jgi:hypothetical protein
VSQVLEQLLRDDGRPVVIRDLDSWRLFEVPAHVAAGQDGLLPAVLVAAESIWRGATGKGFRVELAKDANSLLGYRTNAVSGVSFSGLMLSAMEGLDQISRPEGFMSHELSRVVERMNENFGRADVKSQSIQSAAARSAAASTAEPRPATPGPASR